MIKIPVKKTKRLLIALIAIILIHVSFAESKVYIVQAEGFYCHANEVEYQALLNSVFTIRIADVIGSSEIVYLSALPEAVIYLLYMAYAIVLIIFIQSIKIERNED